MPTRSYRLAPYAWAHSVSRQVAIPLNMDMLTLNVMIASETAANSSLPMCPTEKIETKVKENWRKKVVTRGKEAFRTIQNSVFL